MPLTPTLIVHGGAWAIPDDMIEAHKQRRLERPRHRLCAFFEDGKSARSKLSKPLSPSSKTTRPSTPAAAAFSPATDGSSSTPCSWTAPTSAPAASPASSASATPSRPPASSSTKVHTSTLSVQGRKTLPSNTAWPLIDNAELVLDRERARLVTGAVQCSRRTPRPYFRRTPLRRRQVLRNRHKTRLVKLRPRL